MKREATMPTIGGADLGDLGMQPAAMQNNRELIQQATAARLLRVKVVGGCVMVAAFGTYTALTADVPALIAFTAPAAAAVILYGVMNYVFAPRYQLGRDALEHHNRSVRAWKGVQFNQAAFDADGDGDVSEAELALFAAYVGAVHRKRIKPVQADFRAWARLQKGWTLDDAIWEAYTHIMSKAIIGYIRTEDGRTLTVRLIEIVGKRDERKLCPLSQHPSITKKAVKEANLAYYYSTPPTASPRLKNDNS